MSRYLGIMQAVVKNTTIILKYMNLPQHDLFMFVFLNGCQEIFTIAKNF